MFPLLPGQDDDIQVDVLPVPRRCVANACHTVFLTVGDMVKELCTEVLRVWEINEIQHRLDPEYCDFCNVRIRASRAGPC
jgi:hypothetical protein